jgi:hypothetical protein
MFGTKKGLFRLAAAAGDLRGAPSLAAMGAEYRRLLADRTRLLLQMQGFAACDDPDVRETVQAAFGTLWNTVSAISGLDPARVKIFIAIGMLLNDVAAMDASNLDLAWAKARLTPTPIEFFR